MDFLVEAEEFSFMVVLFESDIDNNFTFCAKFLILRDKIPFFKKKTSELL